MGFRDARMAGSAILVIAFIKVRFVILDFMELRHAPRMLRSIAELWVAGMAAILITLAWLAPTVASERHLDSDCTMGESTCLKPAGNWNSVAETVSREKSLFWLVLS